MYKPGASYKYMHNLRDRLTEVHDRVQKAARAAGRDPRDVRVLAVSKTQPAGAIRELYEAGQRAFGESYVREALEKQEHLRSLAIEWHFIGPLQSNKTRDIAANFDWVHSLEREKIAVRLNDQRPAALPALNVCIQLNLDAEAAKQGVDRAGMLPLARRILDLPRLRLRGLMAIPARRDDYAGQLAAFTAVREALEALRVSCPGTELDTLSMGMSGDLEAAVAADSTWVRVGTDLFGPRAAKGATV